MPRSRCDSRPSRSGRLLERSVKRVEHRHSVLEQRLVVLIRELQAFNHGADRAAFRRPKAAVLEIQVMHDRSDPRERRSSDAKDRAQRLEGASLTLVTELDAEHVERDAVTRDGLPIGSETESGLTIDEVANEPGRRHAIDTRPRPRDPQARLKRRPPSRVVVLSRRRW